MIILPGILMQQTLFTPADITTELWCDTSDVASVTIESGYVSQLNDKSGNARHFTQTTADSRPSYQSAVQNGLNVIRFDGTDDFMSIPSSNAMFNYLYNADSTVFIVLKIGNSSNPNTYYIVLDNAHGGSREGFMLYFDDRSSLSRNNNFRVAALRMYRDFTYEQAINDSITPNQFNILSHIGKATDGTAANRSEVIVNGTALVKTSTATGVAYVGNANYNLFLCRQALGLGNLLGDVCELIICSSALSTDTFQKVEGYLAHKWGLTSLLPAGHPYKIFLPSK